MMDGKWQMSESGPHMHRRHLSIYRPKVTKALREGVNLPQRVGGGMGLPPSSHEHFGTGGTFLRSMQAPKYFT